MTHNSNKAVIVALFGNATIAIIKFFAAFFTLSASMLAEAIHSVADCLNQIFLLIGSKRSRKSRDEIHAFGYGREEFFWGFMVAILLFFVGASFSIYEGIHKLFNPEPIKYIWWALGILFISAVIESKSFSIAYIEFRKTSKGGFMKGIKESVNVNLMVILLEDAAALLGLLTALICTALAFFNPVFDAIGSILIGLLLGYVSISLTNELRKLIIGESMPRKDRTKIKEIVKEHYIVRHINRIQTMTMGRNQYLLLLSINVDDFTHGYSIESTIAEMKKDIRHLFPQINEIYIEIEQK